MGSGTALVAVVGGGFMGMSVAEGLRGRGLEVCLIEGGPSLGGLADAAPVGPAVWDRFYHVVLLSDRRLLALLEELGLTGEIRWGTTRTGFYTDGRHHRMSTALEFLTFPPLGLVSKARLAATILRASRMADGLPLEEVTVTDWLGKWSGRRTLEKIWRPLLRSKLGENYRIASAAFIWATIARMYSARRSGLKQEMFGYVDGGCGRIVERFERRLRERGVEVRTGRAVATVEREGEGVVVAGEDGTREAFDAAVLTVPCGTVARLCPGLTDEERQRLGRVTYQRLVCVTLLLEAPLGDCYITNITDDGLPFTGVIETTALVDRERFGGRSLVYLPRYLTGTDPLWDRPDAEILEQFLRGIERMYPAFRRDQVAGHAVHRATDVCHVPTLRYSAEALPRTRTSLEGVFVVNSAQIALGTMNLNEIVTHAAGAVPLLASAIADAAGRSARGSRGGAA